jgi:hypothetical protein
MPLRPACCICVSDCDANGLLTNCQHFLCSRCSAKYPPGTCPRCQKPCKAIKLNAQNFPRDILERMQADPLSQLKSIAQTFEFQQRQQQVAHVRMREILVGLTGNNQQLQQRCQRLEKELQASQESNSRLATELSELKRQPNQAVQPPSPGLPARSSPFRADFGNTAIWSSPGHQTPLGWGRTKRDREESVATPLQAADPFRLSTPAVAAVRGLGDAQQPVRLQSLLPQQASHSGAVRVIHSSSGHHGDPFTR